MTLTTCAGRKAPLWVSVSSPTEEWIGQVDLKGASVSSDFYV